MLDGSIAPARRVGFPAFEDSVAQFTPEGYQLFAAGVSWMLDIDPPSDGDTNGDRAVDLADFSVIASNFLTGEFDPGTRASVYTPEKLRWRDEGDLNWDRVVDFADFGAWKRAALAGAEPVSAVPEPSSLAWLGWGVLLFLFRRQTAARNG
jgi:hypothetical protein